MTLGVAGFTMYQAMPARCGPPPGFSAVSSAPYRVGGGADEQLPATGLAVEEQGRLVVQAEPLGHGRGRGGTRAGLLLLGRDAVLADGQDLVAETDRRARRVQRRAVRQRPHDELVGAAGPGGAGDRVLRLVGGIRAQEVLGAVVREVELRPGRLRGPQGEARL